MKERESHFAKELLAWRNKECSLRKELLVEPAFWSGNLEPLRELHGEIAQAMESYINHWGWPGYSSVGNEAAIAAGYLVSHCVTQPQFMRFCLPFLEQAFRFGDAWGVFFAELYDTVMYFEGKLQVYGTFLDWDLEGNLAAWKVVEAKKVNARRRAMLLEPMSKYLSRMQQQSRDEYWIVPEDIRSYREGVVQFAHKYGWKRLQSKEEALSLE